MIPSMLGILVSICSPFFSANFANTGAIGVFVESRRCESNGPGKIIYIGSYDFNNDSVSDALAIYTYDHGPNRGDRVWGQYVVAFLSSPDCTHKATNVMFVPDSELMTANYFKVMSQGGLVEVTGEKRLPGDAMCCPTGISTIIFSVIDGRVVTLSGSWYRKTDQ